MKIENQRAITLKMKFLGFIIALLLFVLLFVNIFYKVRSNNLHYVVNIPLSILIILSIWRFFALRYFSFDNSGEVISIKYCHPLYIDKKLSPNLEFPVKNLHIFSIETNFMKRHLKIKIKNSKNKVKVFKYSLQNFSMYSIQRIKDSLR
jgi:hypothetical protein